MSEELEPRHYSDRELTLSAISLTFQRARTVQRELTGTPSWPQVEPEADTDDEAPASGHPSDEGVSDAAGTGSDRPPTTAPRPGDDVDSDINDGPGHSNGAAGGDDARRLALDESEEPDLPNPIVTDANLRHYLDQAAAHQGSIDGPLGLGRLTGRSDQALYNAAMVHALHQLDHRTRLQQRTITRLEAELADARRALAALETNELRAQLRRVEP